MSEQNPFQNKVEEIDMALLDMSIERGNPHSHFEVVNSEQAAAYEQAAEEVGSVALKFIDLKSDAALEFVEGKPAGVLSSWEELAERGFMGAVVSTIEQGDGKHPDDGTQGFYDRVKELQVKEK